jgi:xanthine dehydrogenase accessory factor
MASELSLADLHRKLVKLAQGDLSFALGVILRADGSTPQKAGVKALIEASGRIWGTLGGGLVEAEAQRLAIEACRSKQPIVFDFLLRGADAADATAICGGAMRLLLDPTIGGQAANREAYAQAAQAAARRERGVVLTTLETANSTSVAVQWLPETEAASLSAPPGSLAVLSCLGRETPQLVTVDSPATGEAIEVFIEPVIAPPRLVIAGGGHVGQAVAQQASLLGFEITVIDDRPEFTEPALFPAGVATRCGPIAEQIRELLPAADTYVVIVTRNHVQDAEVLAACIRAALAYLGMIGSRRKVALMREQFLGESLATEEEFNRVFAPIGLDIGAVTVAEIAASIVAQLVAVRRQGRGLAREYGRS